GVGPRATVGGATRVFYLADRGGDARAAMQRFRADLDAVRTALRNALTAAQAVAVREARLAVLDQLRARLQGRPTEAEPVSRYNPEGRLLYPALDLGTAGDEYRKSELAYLPSSCPPVSFLERWARELAGRTRDRSGLGLPRPLLPAHRPQPRAVRAIPGTLSWADRAGRPDEPVRRADTDGGTRPGAPLGGCIPNPRGAAGIRPLVPGTACRILAHPQGQAPDPLGPGTENQAAPLFPPQRHPPASEPRRADGGPGPGNGISPARAGRRPSARLGRAPTAGAGF